MKHDEKTLTLTEACSLADIIRAAQGNQQVARLDAGEVLHGEARSIGLADGTLARGEDIRDLYLRVTLHNGFEAFWAIRELLPMTLTGEFVTGYRAGGYDGPA